MNRINMSVLAMYGVALLGLTAYGYNTRANEITSTNDNEILHTMMDVQGAPAMQILQPPRV